MRLSIAALLAVLMSLVSPMPVAAQGNQQWTGVGSAGKPGDSFYRNIYIDTSRIRVEGNIAQAWIRDVYQTAQKDTAGRWYLTQETSSLFDCNRRSVAITSIIEFDNNGQAVANMAWKPADVVYYDARPGSINEGMLNFVCSKARSSQAESKAAASAQLVKYASDASGDYLYLPSGLTFIGSVFQVAVAVNLKKPYQDKETDRTVISLMMGLHGDCANSSIAYDSLDAVDKAGVIPGRKLSNEAKRAYQPERDDPLYLTLQFVCGTKGYTVTPGVAKKEANENKKGGGASGTAFAVTSTGLLLTNHHVIDQCKTLTAYGADGNTVSAHVVNSDPRNDLALVKIDTANTTALPIRAQAIRAGDAIVALGFPYRGILATEVNVSTGTVSALAGLRNDTSQLQIQAPVQPGNSGGPLVDMSGAVAGVVVAKLDALAMAKTTGDVPQNVNFAVKGEIATLFLKSANAAIKFAAPNAPRMDAAEVANKVKPSVYLLECKYD